MKKRRAWSILGNSQRLDGGAMFGNAPRALWQKWIEPDELNRIPLACRALLVEDEGRLILFEAGIGAFFPPQLRDRFGVQEDRHVLLDNLEKAGFAHEDVDCVVLSHLHFDHAGGLLSAYDPAEPMRLLFPKATFVVSWDAWNRAKHPHARDRASFIAELPPLLEESGRLEVVKGHRSETLGSDYKLWLSEGHTPGLMLTEIPGADGPLVYAADLIPGRAWVHLPITMGYDRYPEQLIDEKTDLLARLVEQRGRLFFTHDHEVAIARVSRNEKGRFSPEEPRAELTGAPL
ncbi:MAG TPA: MBL fold metallo-hydrolase [Polyangiales bacterium]|jgi:glyoxylase-like metal-dependent hydrolase (beta-lactamase superfamily II)|nr:MBL fold metallo-hydrolase [Polyangiales bacterium]